MKPFAVLILAAGLSHRMGKFKPLLSIGGETFIDHLISTFLNNGVEVYVVVGYRGEELKAAIKERHITTVENPEYKLGMFTSIQAGVLSLTSDYEAFFVMPVDIPLVRSATIKRLTAASMQNPGRIIYPVFNQKRGHPPLIPISLAQTITGWNKEGSLKEVLDSFEYA